MPLLQKAYLGSTALFRNTASFEDNVFTFVETSTSVAVTASSTTHTKGAWSELIASTTANGSLLYLELEGFDSGVANGSTLLDIGFGASGSEVVKIENISIGGADNLNIDSSRYVLHVPFQVPSGTRVAARIQSAVTSNAGNVLCRIYDTGDYSTAPTSVTTIGTSTATSAGTAFTAANTYVQLIASTSAAYKGIVLIPSVIGSATTTVTATITLATGASGAEVEIARINARYTTSEAVSLFAGEPTLIGGLIPSGTRLAAKIEGPTTLWSNYGVCVIGIP